jgi:hypothetical protein
VCFYLSAEIKGKQGKNGFGLWSLVFGVGFFKKMFFILLPAAVPLLHFRCVAPLYVRQGHSAFIEPQRLSGTE